MTNIGVTRIQFAIGWWFVLLSTAMLLSGNAVFAQELRPDAEPSFSRDIRPILSNVCFHCHGPDDDARQADLRLDQQEGLFQERDGHAIIRRGRPDESELVRRILSDEPDVRMPPPDGKKNLSDAQRQSLIRWVASGAEWEQHWAFVKPVKSSVPHVAESSDSPSPNPGPAEQPRNEIDAFLLQTLRANGLTLSGPADSETLLRRLFLDLIGLPPTIEEADEWISRLTGENRPNGESKTAPISDDATGLSHSGDHPGIDEHQYAALVDHLLMRPEYGERWARHWLDVARYADTNGYEKDRDRSIWPYRDWVVSAINSDLPFDEFTIEQLAGDLLPDATQAQRIATGFHRNTMLNEEGGIDPLEFRFHAMTDRVATTGTTWLGLTTGCAQCHTHKYDPITHREYYQFMALLNNCDEPSLELRGDDFDEQWKRNRDEAARLLAELPDRWPPSSAGTDSKSRRNASSKNAEAGEAPPDIQTEFERWLGEHRKTAVDWHPLHPTAVRANLAHLTIQPDDTIFASGDTAKQDFYEIDLAPHDRPVTAIRLEVLPDERLPARGPGTTYYEGTLGDFYLTEFTATVGGRPVPIRQASHSYARNQFGKNPVSAQLTLDNDIQTGWSVYNAQGERNTAVYVLDAPLTVDQPLTIRMTFGRHFASSLGLFRFAAADDIFAPENAPVARRMPDAVEQLLRSPDDQLNEQQRTQLFEEFLLSAPQLADDAERIRKLRLPPTSVTTLVLSERPLENPRPTFRHHRGEYLQPRELVTPGTPEFLHEWPSNVPRNRLGLAKWLVSPDNPLTARVIVNRHWAALFGRGLVATVDDFGVQGERPSHPELLDWLAVTFMADDNWSIRNLHRRIVTSRAYRQSSVRKQDAMTIDPDNRLLAYAPRFRLDAEILRDSALRASGTLSTKMGGPPVRPPQPPGITEVAFGSPHWKPSDGEDQFRRSLYTQIKRTAPFAMITTFDGLSGESCVAQRTRSNTPLQALTLLNDVMTVDLARATGRLIANEAIPNETDGKQTDTEQMTILFRRLLTRRPVADEISMLSNFVAAQRKRFAEDPRTALELTGEKISADELTDVATFWSLIEEATWTAVARAMFSLDEFQMRP